MFKKSPAAPVTVEVGACVGNNHRKPAGKKIPKKGAILRLTPGAKIPIYGSGLAIY